jgi:DNA-binding transcriptional LysR family regulator
MTLTQLTYFLAIAETGSFTAAARRSYVSQPSLSQQILALESELGGPLIERRKQGIKLTAAGKALLPSARTAVTAAADGRFNAVRALEHGPYALCIAVLASVPLAPVSAAIATARAGRPDLSIRLHLHTDAGQMAARIRDGESALAIGKWPGEDWSGPVVSLGKQTMVLAVAAPSDIVDGTSLDELTGHDWVVLDHGADPSLHALARANVEPPRPMAVSHLDALLALVAAGVGVALVDPDALAGRDDVRAVHLAEPQWCEWFAYAGAPWSAAGLEVVAALTSESDTMLTRPPSTIRS